MIREMRVEDDFGDEVELKFHSDATMEISVLSGNADTRVRKADRNGEAVFEGAYIGGFVLDVENAERFHQHIGKFLEEARTNAI